MKISIATGPWLPVPAVQGGAVPRLWQGLAEQFVALGNDVNILCRAYPNQAKHEVINGVRYIRRGGFSQSANIWMDLIKDFIYALTTTPVLPQSDVLVINDFWLPALACFHPKIGKTVVNVNRFPKGQFPLYRWADRFAVVSRSVQHEIARQCPAAVPKIRILPNPIDTEIFRQSVSLPQAKEDLTLLYVGRLHPEKGVHLLIESFSRLSQQFPHLTLQVVGPFEVFQGGGGRTYLNDLKLASKGLRVDFLDPVFEPQKLAEVYQSADVFCYPSLAEKGEAFGVAPLEAMSSGLVPIVSDLDCFKDFITHDLTGYIFNHRGANAAENLVSAVTSALKNREKLNKIAKQAQQKATEYSYTQVANLYLEDFEALLN